VNDVGLFLRRHRTETTAVIERLDDDLVGQTSSFCCTSPCTFTSLVAPRMSTRPALRTLLAIILPASAMS
jgi:hypothetical protein